MVMITYGDDNGDDDDDDDDSDDDDDDDNDENLLQKNPGLSLAQPFRSSDMSAPEAWISLVFPWIYM